MTDTEPRKTTRSLRAALTAEFTPEQITAATRGLSFGEYAKAFHAAEKALEKVNEEEGEEDLDVRLNKYMSTGPRKSEAQEHAFLDGNTWSYEWPEDHLRERITRPEDH